MNQEDLQLAADWITGGRYVTAFTGAGISVESGIPAFRGDDGIWSKYDPDILEISNFIRNPEATWPVIHEIFYQYFKEAKPNFAHKFLAYLEKQKHLKSIITQNIDNMHQESGSNRVIEYHGNSHYLVCMECGERRTVNEQDLSGTVPRCGKDHAIMKPDFVFFGEPIPGKAAQDAILEAGRSDVMILIGTTGEVMPASMIPRMAKNAGAKIIEINTETSVYTNDITNLFLKGKAGEVCESLMKLV